MRGLLLIKTMFTLALASPLARAASWSVTVSDLTGRYSSLYSTMISHTQIAGQTWSNFMQASGASIDVQILIHDVPSNRGGGGSSTTRLLKTVNGIKIYEQGAAWELRTGTDPNGATADIVIDLDPDYIDTQMWFDPSPLTRSVPVPNNRIDDMSVFLHELGHAIAMNGWRDWTTAQLPADYESTFDQFVTTVGSVNYFNGPVSTALYGGPVPLKATNLYHVGNSAPLPGTDLIPDLMNGVVFNWGQRYYISQLDRAIFLDSGVPISVPEPVGSTAICSCILLHVARRRRIWPRRCYRSSLT